MNWKTTALVQRCFGALPFGSEALYYHLQRSAGALRKGIDLTPYLATTAHVVKHLRELGVRTEGAELMEVGTGHGLGNPIGFYLCGVGTIHTFDLNRRLRPALVMESLRRLLQNLDSVRQRLVPLIEPTELEKRLHRLSSVSNFSELMSIAGVKYHAPSDAADTKLPSQSIDIHFSNNVFEHVPRATLVRLLVEAGRVLTKTGVAYHIVNPADHFARYDRNINSVNFLRFSESQWEKLAGNRFAYHNRLRGFAYRDVYGEAQHDIVAWQETGDPVALEALKSGFRVHPDVQGSPEQLSVQSLEVVSRPAARQ